MDGGASAEAVGRAGDFLAATDAEVVWRTDGFNAGELREQPGGLPGEVVQGLQVAEYLVFGGAAEFLQPAPAFLDGLFGFIYLKKTLRSEEHTSELQSLMRISYAVFCLKKTTKKQVQKE